MPRLDLELVNRGLFPTRAQARLAIKAGKVLCDGRIVKASKEVASITKITVSASSSYVSRGGEKLAAFFDHFPDIQIQNTNVLDVGASTGGFTDCVLQRGAQHVTCVDVGHGQLHPKLQSDPRVQNFEGVHVKNLKDVVLPHNRYGLIVIDLSFISLKKVMGAIVPKLMPGGWCISLIKPQFETTPAIMKKCGGVIKDTPTRDAIINDVVVYLQKHLPIAKFFGPIPSPIIGGDGNVEALVGFQL